MFFCGCHGKKSFKSPEHLLVVNICKTPPRRGEVRKALHIVDWLVKLGMEIAYE